MLQGELDFASALAGINQLPRQLEFIRSPFHNAALVGGQGAAKTVALCLTAIANALSEANGMSLIGRLNMPALETSTMRTFLELVPESEGKWQESKRQFIFNNGHVVLFRHLDITDPKIVGHIRSMNLSAVYVDEGSEISEEVYFLLLGRLRRKGARHIFRIVSNPAGHDWMWRNFFDPKRKDALQKSNQGIVVSSMDNPFLPEDYIQNMLNTYPEDWAQRFIYGSFADFSDLVYKEFTEATHTWDPRLTYAIFGGRGDPPLSWPIVIGIDIGSDIDPWAIQLAAVAPDGRLYEYAEVYGNNMLISDIAKRMRPHMEGRRVSGIAYDYANRQCALELAEYDICGSPAIKEVEPGLFKTSQYFHLDTRLPHAFNPRIEGSPRIYISRACVNAIRELGEYKWARNRSGIQVSEPAHVGSHSNDARRYYIHTFRPFPQKDKVPEKWDDARLDLQSRMYWKAEDVREKKLEKLRARGPMKTMKEWREEAEKPPMRFQRFVNFNRRPRGIDYAK